MTIVSSSWTIFKYLMKEKLMALSSWINSNKIMVSKKKKSWRKRKKLRLKEKILKKISPAYQDLTRTWALPVMKTWISMLRISKLMMNSRSMGVRRKLRKILQMIVKIGSLSKSTTLS